MQCPHAAEWTVDLLAYIHDTDVETLNTLLLTQTPEEVVATFPYLSDREKSSPAGPCSTSGRNARGEADAAAPHRLDGAAKVQWSGGGRYARPFRCIKGSVPPARIGK
jgi:hypothetical protein